MATEMEQLWGFLRPWTSVLRSQIKYKALHLDSDVWGEMHRLEVSLPMRCHFSGDSDGEEFEFEREWPGKEYFQTIFLRTREALALLAAVAHVDQKAWKYLLVRHCGVNLGKQGSAKFERHIPAEFYLLLDQDEDSRTCDKSHLGLDLVHFCGTDHRTRPTQEYSTTLAKIAALDTTLQTGEPGVDIVVPVQSLYPCHTLGGPQVLKNVLRSEKAIHEMWNSVEQVAVPSGQLRCTFMLKPVVADLEEILDWELMAAKVGKLMNKGLCFSEMELRALRDANGDEELTRIVFGELMVHLFGITCCPRELVYPPALCEKTSVSSQHQIDLLKLDCHPRLLSEDLHAMGSAMVTNQTTGELVMNLSFPVDRTGHFALNDEITPHEWWQWIAYAFFSKRARACSSLTSLALVNIRTMCFEDMEQAFGPLVESDHPEEVLFGCPRGSVDDRDAHLKADSPIRWQFGKQGQPVLESAANRFSTPLSARTFSDDGTSEWVNVMVPGFGRCQVERHNLEFRQVSAADVGASSLTSLTLSFEKVGRNWTSGLADFLRLVGRTLKSLTLENAGPSMDLNERSTLQLCPNLDELSICGGMVDVLLDFRRFRPDPSQGGNIDWHNVVNLSRDLSDMNNPFVQCVRRLRVWLDNAWWPCMRTWDSYNPPDFAADMNSLVDMLEKNNRIEYVEVIVGERHKQHLAGLKTQPLKSIRSWSRFPTENKIALLSVLSSRNLGASDEFKKRRERPSARVALYETDRHVLSHIFAFAEHHAEREVYVRWQSERGFDDDDDRF